MQFKADALGHPAPAGQILPADATVLPVVEA